MTTRSPASRNILAIARPSPADPPVTTTPKERGATSSPDLMKFLILRISTNLLVRSRTKTGSFFIASPGGSQPQKPGYSLAKPAMFAYMHSL